MPREDVYKGLEDEKFKNMPLDEFIKLIGSRERRTILRLSTNPKYKKLIERVRKIKKAGKNMIKTHVRDAVILPEWLGMKFGVHNGKEFKTIEINVKMLGKRLGEFAHCTGRVKHSGPGVGATRGSKFVPLK